jgi:ribose-phosphate pyrophosphokinase
MAKLTLFSGTANLPLAEAVASTLGTALGECSTERFPDDEIRITIHTYIQGHDVFLVQPTCPPVAADFLELMFLADACQRAGAARLTAVIPYYGYARQDRRERPGEAVAARLIADTLCTRFDRVIAVDLHNPAIEGFFDIPVVHLSAVPLLADALRSLSSRDHVVVAPDLGAVKLAQKYADLLGLPVAYAHKVRLNGRKTEVHQIIGEVQGRSPIVVDDMISTGGTMISTVEELLKRGCSPRLTLVASHSLFVEKALERLSAFPIERVLVTDSVPQVRPHPSLSIQIISLKNLLAEAIQRLHASGE